MEIFEILGQKFSKNFQKILSSQTLPESNEMFAIFLALK